MRIVLLGTASLSITTARQLIDNGYEVVVIEPDPEKVEKLNEELDCSFITGDARRPVVLKEVGPKNTDFLFCLAEKDEDNIIVALVGRSLGFGRVVISIKDPDYAPICAELGLDDTILLDQAVAHDLADMVAGVERAGLSAAVRGGLRFLAFHIGSEHAGKLSDLGLPRGTRVVAVTRGRESRLATDDTTVTEGDEILVAAEMKAIESLHGIFRRHDDPKIRCKELRR
jgi:trk/ktr system potassium uptake protein